MTTPAVALPAVSAYPPSFGGEAVWFGLALFSLTATLSISTAIMLEIPRRWRTSRAKLIEPLGIVMAGLFSLLAAFWFEAIGDVAFMLAWGEVTPSTMSSILAFDRICDALVFPAFCIFLGLLIRGQYIVHFQLTGPTALPGDLWPTWKMVRRQMIAVGVLVFIAVGVTVGK